MKKLWIVMTVVACTNVQSFAGQAELAGTVWMIKGEVSAEVKDSTLQKRPLRLGEEVRNGEAISSSAQGEAVLRMVDGALVAVRPNTYLELKDIRKPDQDNAAFVVGLVRGGLRVLSGLTGKKNPRAYRISTSTATIGIRGTDHEVFVVPTGERIGRNTAGSYDKVNSGATYMEMEGKAVDVQVGQVAFARDIAKDAQGGSRALATLLRPVILRYVPEFYRVGTFDSEFDAVNAKKAQEPANECDSGLLARQWLGKLDAAVGNRKVDDVLTVFSDNLIVRVNPASNAEAGKKPLVIDRQTFTDSVFQSISELEDFNQVRTAIDVLDVSVDKACNQFKVVSEVRENGTAAGKKYESVTRETFLIQKSASGLQAVSAELEPLR